MLLHGHPEDGPEEEPQCRTRKSHHEDWRPPHFLRHWNEATGTQTSASTYTSTYNMLHHILRREEAHRHG